MEVEGLSKEKKIDKETAKTKTEEKGNVSQNGESSAIGEIQTSAKKTVEQIKEEKTPCFTTGLMNSVLLFYSAFILSLHK